MSPGHSFDRLSILTIRGTVTLIFMRLLYSWRQNAGELRVKLCVCICVWVSTFIMYNETKHKESYVAKRRIFIHSSGYQWSLKIMHRRYCCASCACSVWHRAGKNFAGSLPALVGWLRKKSCTLGYKHETWYNYSLSNAYKNWKGTQAVGHRYDLLLGHLVQKRTFLVILHMRHFH